MLKLLLLLVLLLYTLSTAVLYLLYRLFYIIVDRPQHVTESDKKNIEVLIIKKTIEYSFVS